MDLMALRRRILAADPLLPPGYERKKCVVNTQYAFFATDYTPRMGDQFDVLFMPTRDGGGLQALFSCGTGTYQTIALMDGIRIHGVKNSFYVKCFSSATGELLSGLDVNAWYNFKLYADGTAICNGTTIKVTPAHEIDGAGSLYVFRRANTRYPFIGKLASFKVSNNGILTLNLIPCVRLLDNKVGMYDSVNKVFYSSASSSTQFIAE